MIQPCRQPRRSVQTAMLACWLAVALPASALVTLKPDPGFGGTFAAGSWSPLRVLAENMADPAKPEDKPRDVNGELRVTVFAGDQTIRFTHPLELPAQSRKLVEMPVIFPDGTLPIRVEMTDSKGRAVASAEMVFPKNSGADQRRVTGVIPTVLIEQDPNRSLDYPAWGADAVNVQRIALESLPSDIKGYAEVKALLIRGRVSNKLEPQQLAALQMWLELGGTLLVIAANSPAELKLDTWLADRMPALPDAVREARLEELSETSGPDLILVASWEAIHQSAEEILTSREGEPLVLRRRVGAGEVIAFAVDPAGLSREALAKSSFGAAVQRIFDGVLFRGAREDIRARHNWSTADVTPGFKVDLLPERSVIILVIVAFVLIVGPLNFNYLRRKRRLELAWVTIPVFSIVFFFAVYGFGVLTKGHQQFWASAEILHLSSGQSRGLLLWTATQFSPASRAYRLTPPPDGSILPLGQYYEPPSGSLFGSLLGGAKIAGDTSHPSVARLTPERGYDLIYPGKQWSVSYFQGERPMEIEGTIDGSVTLLAEDEVIIEIANNTQTALLNATVYIGEQPIVIGDLQPGETYASRQTVDKARVTGRQDYAGTSDPDEVDRQTRLLQEAQLKDEISGASRPSSPFGDPFEESVFVKVSLGSHAMYPIQPLFHPQRRARLIARQKAWQSEVKIVPAPDETRIAGLVEVALPVKVAGTVQLGSSVGIKVRRLRAEVVDYDPDGATFFTEPGKIASLNEGWIDVILSPPDLTGTVEFFKGTLEIRVTGPSSFLLVRAFNFQSGQWDVVYQDISSTEVRAKDFGGPAPVISKQWVNPLGNYVKIRVDGREPPKTAAQKAGRNLNVFSGSGIELDSVGGMMTFKGDPPPPKPAGEDAPEAGGGDGTPEEPDSTSNSKPRGREAKQ